MMLLTHRLVLAEIAQLLKHVPDQLTGLHPDDFKFEGDVLVCDPAGRLLLTDQVKQMTLNEFSTRLLVPFLTRMTRLKALHADLVELGVKFE